jgi:hypothetical protein
MFKAKWQLNLQMFNDGGEGGAGAGNGAGGAGSGEGGSGSGEGSGGNGGQNHSGTGGQGGSGGEVKPYLSFPDEASFMSRIKREGSKQVGEFLKGLGFEKQEDLKTIIDTHQANIEAGKTELQKEKDRNAALEKERNTAIETSNAILRKADAKLQAAALGIKPERVDYALKLANIDAVEVKDGVVDNAAIKAALEAVLKDLPELKGVAVPPAGGGDFGGGSGGGDKPPLTMELIRGMTTAESEARLPEIMEFLSKNSNN